MQKTASLNLANDGGKARHSPLITAESSPTSVGFVVDVNEHDPGGLMNIKSNIQDQDQILIPTNTTTYMLDKKSLITHLHLHLCAHFLYLCDDI